MKGSYKGNPMSWDRYDGRTDIERLSDEAFDNHPRVLAHGDALDVPCPTCDATKDEDCHVTTTGALRSFAHPRRMRAGQEHKALLAQQQAILDEARKDQTE